MNILLDTHYLIWAFVDTGKMQKKVYEKMLDQDNEVFYSQTSLWEIAIKYNLGKLTIKGMKPEELYEEIKNSYMQCRKLENDELITFYRLPIEHRDPFDRILVWQAIRSDYHFLSVDKEIARYKKHGLKLLN